MTSIDVLYKLGIISGCMGFTGLVFEDTWLFILGGITLVLCYSAIWKIESDDVQNE